MERMNKGRQLPSGEQGPRINRRRLLKTLGVVAGGAALTTTAFETLKILSHKQDLSKLHDALKVDVDPIARITQLLDMGERVVRDSVWNGIGKRMFEESGDSLYNRFTSIIENHDAKGNPRGKLLDHRWLMRLGTPQVSECIGGLAPGVPEDMSVSRLDLVRAVFGASEILPDVLKGLIPYLPMEESGYRDGLTSGAGAHGVWQFMPETARKYGLTVSRLMDERKDFIDATIAARAMFEDVYTTLLTSSEYRSLYERLKLSGDALALMTVNAYNSGTQHMIRALEVMNDVKDTAAQKALQKAIANNSGNADLGVFDYLTSEYPKHYKRYQKMFIEKGWPRYISESPAYPYKVLAFAMVDDPVFDDEAFRMQLPRKMEPPPPRPTDV